VSLEAEYAAGMRWRVSNRVRVAVIYAAMESPAPTTLSNLSRKYPVLRQRAVAFRGTHHE